MEKAHEPFEREAFHALHNIVSIHVKILCTRSREPKNVQRLRSIEQ